jgi:hypothetical protein
MWWLQPICFSCKFQLQLPSKYRKKNHYQLSTLMILKILSYLVPCSSSECNIAHSIVMYTPKTHILNPSSLSKNHGLDNSKLQIHCDISSSCPYLQSQEANDMTMISCKSKKH